MSEYPGREAYEVYSAGSQLANDAARLAILVATLVAEQIAERRRERYEAEARASEQRAAAQAERIRAERETAQPLLTAVHQERFWRDADPSRIGRSWQAAAEWAASDPYAAYTLEVLRDNLRDRFGIEVPDVPLVGADLTRVLAVADTQFREVLQEARQKAADQQQVSYAVTISDLNDPTRIVHTREMTVPTGMPAEEAAARAYDEWSRSTDGAMSAHRHDQFAVQLSENTGETRSAVTPAATLSGHEVGEALERAESRRHAIVEGTEQASDADALYAWSVEIDQLAEEETRRRSRRTEYADRLADPKLSEADRRRLAGNVAAIDQGMNALVREQADAVLQTATISARMRGENPQHEHDAARMREGLDSGWWDTASAAEIAAAWEHVGQWDAGSARDGMHKMLREEIMSRYGVPLSADASGPDVAAAFGGVQMPGPASRLRDQGEAMRQQAQALFDMSFDSFGKATQATDRAQLLMEEDPARAQAEGQAAYYTAQAAAQGAEGLGLLDRGNWLSSQDARVTTAAHRADGAAAVERLAAEYEARFGRRLHPGTRAQLAVAAVEVSKTVQGWTVTGVPGSKNPARFTLPGEARSADVGQRRDLGDVRREREAQSAEQLADATGTREPADGLAVSLGVPPQSMGPEAAQRYQERAEAADAALAGLSDREAVEAVSVGAQGFPQSPDVVTDSPPRTGKSGQGSGQQLGRERGTPGREL